jgi:hypothetical protein
MSAASFCRIASTSEREIGFAAAAAGVAGDAVAPAEEGADEDGVAPVDEGAEEDGVAAGVTPAACLEPKMADTMLPKTLIIFLPIVVAFDSRQ